MVICTEKEDRAFLDSSANMEKTDIRLSLIAISTDAGEINLANTCSYFINVLNGGNWW